MNDEFAWLEDTADPRVVKWARKQDQIARKSVKDTSRVLYKRLTNYYSRRIMRSVQLTKAGVFLFFSDEKSYKIELLHATDGHKETIADSAELGKNAVIQGFQARKDGNVMALHYSMGGSDEGTVKVIEVASRVPLDTLHGFVGSILWPGGRSSHAESYFYVRNYRTEKTPDGVKPPGSRVLCRDGEGKRDQVVFGVGLPSNTFVGLNSSNDGSKALVDAYYGWTRSRPFAGEIDRPETWAPIYRKTDSIVLCIDYLDGKHLLLSFEEGLGEVLSVGTGAIKKTIPEGRWPLQEAVLVGRNILCHHLVDACSELRLFDVDGRRPDRWMKFPIPGSLIGLQDGGALSAYGSEAVVAFSSFTLPYVVYRVRGPKLVKVVSEELPGRYVVEHRNARSADGTRIHYFTTTRRGTPRKKKALLFGYGGFRISLSPVFNPAYLPLIDDGAVYAVANLRGGLEHGEDWHQAGMREKKFRVFEDYIAVLESLKGGRGMDVVGFGRSNGGLLMGATMNARPDLFAGVLIGYPVLDMMAFSRLLMGRAWVPEYGDPEVPADRAFLLKYSPYHNITKGKKYPPVFIYTGLKDDRVHPAHAFKFYARLKETGSEVYLRVEVESGHIGTTPKSRIGEEADKLGFVYNALGLECTKRVGPGTRRVS